MYHLYAYIVYVYKSFMVPCLFFGLFFRLRREEGARREEEVEQET